MPNARSDRLERARGAMIGLAAGNALGVPYEFGTAADLRRRFPDGRPSFDEDLADGPMDDDLAQAVVLAEALLEEGVPSIERLARGMLDWFESGAHGIGMLTLEVMTLLRLGSPPADAARQAWEASGRNSAGNGAVMRCAPVALRWPDDPARRSEAARASALVTHHDPRCVWTTVASVEAVAAALNDETLDIAVLADRLAAGGAPEVVVEAARAAIGASLDDWVLDADDQGYTVLCMQVALWAAQAEPDFEAALSAVVMAGGDTDTNGAIAGAVMGARVGLSGIPAAWADGVPERARLLELAQALMH